MSGLGDMSRTFDAAGLPPPPVPKSLQPQLRLLGPWCWGTRDIVPGYMYKFDVYAIEAVTSHLEDYVAISHAGHGVNSYSINYHLVTGPLVIFAQALWGGCTWTGRRRRPR